MKVRLQDIVKNCYDTTCDCCKYCKNGDCIARIDGYIPMEFMNYFWLCVSSPELAKALYTNEVVELHENDSERID
jgi:hypothetical protein